MSSAAPAQTAISVLRGQGAAREKTLVIYEIVVSSIPLRLEAAPAFAEVEDRPSRHDELVRANLDPAGNRDGLAFVQDPEAVLFVDGGPR